jgi:hypothetical protein
MQILPAAVIQDSAQEDLPETAEDQSVAPVAQVTDSTAPDDPTRGGNAGSTASEPPHSDPSTPAVVPAAVEVPADVQAPAPIGPAPTAGTNTPPPPAPDPPAPAPEPTTAPPPPTGAPEAAPTRGKSAAHLPDHANGGVGNPDRPAPSKPGSTTPTLLTPGRG